MDEARNARASRSSLLSTDKGASFTFFAGRREPSVNSSAYNPSPHKRICRRAIISRGFACKSQRQRCRGVVSLRQTAKYSVRQHVPDEATSAAKICFSFDHTMGLVERA
ncbi:hypothetical protein CYMTET_12647 [Cymbomonas tetramitiformis]|uniref:Uncharacterized protein n=1 Tax=Cymbomonas tetramitiformis TaxID=36881 RepID=A0AAE0GJW2_9CHLO|nr:hypothetical protein CYMTET_12647 [Cymbomonas tetramitiformis]